MKRRVAYLQSQKALPEAVWKDLGKFAKFSSSQIQNFLNTEISFEDQLFTWLESIHFRCRVACGKEERFPVLTVHNGTQDVLAVKLIDIQTWRRREGTNELQAYLAQRVEYTRNGIACIILWDDLWKSRQDIVKSRIGSLLGISHRMPARLTKAVRIDKETANRFLLQNHLQSAVQSKYRLGLYLPARHFRVLHADYQPHDSVNLLVAVATFSAPRIFYRADGPFRSYELIRFANLLGTTVVGGLDKLLSAFLKEVQADDLMTYADLEWSDGNGYSRLGFERISERRAIDFMVDGRTNERYAVKNSPWNEDMVKICNAGSVKFVKSIQK